MYVLVAGRAGDVGVFLTYIWNCPTVFSPALKGLNFLLSLSLGIQCDRIYEEQPTASDVEEGPSSKVDNTNSTHVEENVEAEIDPLGDLGVIEEEPEYDNTSSDKNYKPENDTDTGEETHEDDKGPR